MSVTCPACGSAKVQERRKLKSVLPYLAVFGVSLVAVYWPHPPHPLVGILGFMSAFAFFFVSLAVLIYVVADRHRCLECKNRWV